MTYLRYLATTDDSPAGAVALGYLKALLQIQRVRLFTLSGGLHGKWEPYAPLLTTPMDGTFVNVVCCSPNLWTKIQSVAMPRRLPDGSVVYDTASERRELHTAGVRNVLLTGVAYAALTERQREAAWRYDAIAVASQEAMASWNSDGIGYPPLLVTLPVQDIARFALEILP